MLSAHSWASKTVLAKSSSKYIIKDDISPTVSNTELPTKTSALEIPKIITKPTKKPKKRVAKK
jgi:hypothetical protein